MKNSVFRHYVSAMRLGMPVFGDLIFKAELSRFTRAMEISLTSGIPIIKAIAISLPILREDVIREKLEGSIAALQKGSSLSETFGNADVFPPFALNLINIGEESGNLTGGLAEIADAFETDCGDSVDIMINLMEPVMVLAIGLVVGFIVCAVLLPIFQLNIVQM